MREGRSALRSSRFAIATGLMRWAIAEDVTSLLGLSLSG
jgi:hypothetical protein